MTNDPYLQQYWIQRRSEGVYWYAHHTAEDGQVKTIDIYIYKFR